MRRLVSSEQKDIYERMNRAAGALLREIEALLFPEESGISSGEDFREKLRTAWEKGDAYRRKAYEILDEEMNGAAEADAALLQRARRHVHTDTGRVLIATRYFLEKDERGESTAAQKEKLLADWREVLDAIQSGSFNEAQADVRTQLNAAGKETGIRIIYTGEIPTDPENIRRYAKEAAAKIMAAVRAGETSVEL